VDQNNQEQFDRILKSRILASISELDRFLESRILARAELLRACIAVAVAVLEFGMKCDYAFLSVLVVRSFHGAVNWNSRWYLFVFSSCLQQLQGRAGLSLTEENIVLLNHCFTSNFEPCFEPEALHGDVDSV
jgi:hypothetical protein